MCGIVYAHDFSGSPVNNIVLDTFDNQRQRGIEGFGLFNGKHLVKAAEEDRILNWLCKEKNDSDVILFHHRYPTSTENVRRAAHPFTTKSYFGDTEYILVHNGIINNPWDMHDKHEKLGIEYQSVLQNGKFNDSEALLWEVALTLEGKQEKVEATGNIAFVCMKLEGGVMTKLYFGRNSRPLNMLREKQGILLSSEGDGEAIETNTLYTWNYALKRMTTRRFVLKEDNFKEFENWNWRSGKSYVPATTTYGKPWDNDYHFEDDEKYELIKGSPYQAEIDDRYLQYIMAASGVFEVAYWKIEYAYQDALEECEYTGDFYESVILEAVLEMIETDEEYLNETSVSSLWSEICEIPF